MDELQDVTIDYIITMCCEAEVLFVFLIFEGAGG